MISDLEFSNALCRENFDAFAQRAFAEIEPGIPYEFSWHIGCICWHLQALFEGTLPDNKRRLCINVPPRSLKSYLASIAYPAWVLGKKPNEKFIATSFNATLAKEMSQKSRILIESEWYKQLFPAMRIDDNQNEKHNYWSTERGMYYSSALMSVTGRGAGTVILDDPISPKEAISDTIRQDTNATIRSTIPTRFNDLRNDKWLLIMQRIHDDDPTGHFALKDPRWFILKLPGENKTGKPITYELNGRSWTMQPDELLFPDRLTRQVLDDLRTDLGDYNYCTPAGSPVLMADLSNKPIDQIIVGDEILGFEKQGSIAIRRKMKPALVQKITISERKVVKVTLDSGRVIKCTDDHKWYTGRGNTDKTHKMFDVVKIGRKLMRVCDPLSRFIIEEEKVVSIEDDGIQKVYGLTTETGTYVVWGLASHNCGQILQEPVPIGGGDFRQEWIQYYHQGACKPKEMNIVILVDPAGGDDLNKKKRKLSDWTAMMVVGFAPDNNKYLLDIVRDRLNPTDRVNTLFMLHKKWNGLTGKSPKVGYEKYGMMSDTHYIDEKKKQDAYNFPLIILGGTMSKEERIKQLIPDLQNGRLFFPQNLIYVDGEGRRFDLVSEIVNGEMPSFPRARHDDMLDALSRMYEPDLCMVFPKPKVGMIAKARANAYEDNSQSWEQF